MNSFFQDQSENYSLLKEQSESDKTVKDDEVVSLSIPNGEREARLAIETQRNHIKKNKSDLAVMLTSWGIIAFESFDFYFNLYIFSLTLLLFKILLASLSYFNGFYQTWNGKIQIIFLSGMAIFLCSSFMPS
jgi:hypothetical protein